MPEPKEQTIQDYEGRAMSVVASSSEEERQKLHEELTEKYEVDLDNLPKVNHNWVDRGTVLSCEGAGHANHRHFKLRK